jgi:hypothetical protein
MLRPELFTLEAIEVPPRTRFSCILLISGRYKRRRVAEQKQQQFFLEVTASLGDRRAWERPPKLSVQL